MTTDFYKVLGVERAASQDDIKQAYRRLAHLYHPDKAGGNEDKFKEINEAYQVLSDPQKRGQYDQFGQTFQGGGPNNEPGSGGFDFGGRGNPFEGFDFGQFSGGFGTAFDINDIFSEMFGASQTRTRGRRKGSDIAIDVELTLEEVFAGVDKELRFRSQAACPTCRGAGYEAGTALETCGRCQGLGTIRQARRSILGTISVQSTCPDCNGQGQRPARKCPECQGDGRVKQDRRVVVSIPAGIEEGMTVAVTGEGEAAGPRSTPGDLLVRVRVKPHPVFTRDGQRVRASARVPYPDLVFGAIVQVPTLDGSTRLTIPAGTQSGKEFHIRGKGFPANGSGRGDEIVTIEADVPKHLSRRAADLLQEFQSETTR